MISIGFGLGSSLGWGGGGAAPVVPTAYDARLLSTAADLQFYYRAENNLALSSTMFATGSAPPVVTITNNLTTPTDLQIFIRSSTTYDWGYSDSLGWVWGGIGATIPNGSTATLDGHVVAFASGTYAN